MKKKKRRRFVSQKKHESMVTAESFDKRIGIFREKKKKRSENDIEVMALLDLMEKANRENVDGLGDHLVQMFLEYVNANQINPVETIIAINDFYMTILLTLAQDKRFGQPMVKVARILFFASCAFLLSQVMEGEGEDGES